MAPPKEDGIDSQGVTIEKSETILEARLKTKNTKRTLSNSLTPSSYRQRKRKRKSALNYDDYLYENPLSSTDQPAAQSLLDILGTQPVISATQPLSNSLTSNEIPPFIKDSSITSYLTLYTPSSKKPHTGSTLSSTEDVEKLIGSESDALQYILKELKQLRSTQEKHTQILNDLMEKINFSPPNINSTQEFKLKLPVKYDFELIEIDSLLGDSDYKSELFSRLKALGGSDYKDHARRCLRYVMVDSVADLYSWLGCKDKQSFSTLKILEVIIDAVSHNQKSVTKSQVEHVIKNWLRHARERKMYAKKNK